MQPKLTGQIVPVLTVRDADASAAWYAEVFGGEKSNRYESDDGTVQVVLTGLAAGLEICLLSRPNQRSDLFDERRIGLDHLEFLVANRADLDRWVMHLDLLGITHSGIKEPDYSSTAMVTFRDRDNVQLEVFWPGR